MGTSTKEGKKKKNSSQGKAKHQLQCSNDET